MLLCYQCVKQGEFSRNAKTTAVNRRSISMGCASRTRRGQGCTPYAATATTFSRKEPMQTTRQSSHRLGPPDRPGRYTTSAVCPPKGGPSPAAASLLLLRAGDIEPNPGPHCNTCGYQVRHGISLLRCSSANCPTVSHKSFACSSLHRSNLPNR